MATQITGRVRPIFTRDYSARSASVNGLVYAGASVVLRLFLDRPFDVLRLLVLILFAASMFVVGAGYRRLGGRILASSTLAVVGGLLSGFAAVVVALSLVGRGEWAGIAAAVLAIAFGWAGGLLCFAFSFWRLVWKQREHLGRERASPVFLALGGLGIVLAIWMVRWAFPFLPARSDASLVAQHGIGVGSAHDTEHELLRRGQRSVPLIIAALEKFPEAEARQFESGRTIGLKNHLRLLGKLGGPEAIRELRKWFHSGAAPDIRTEAAAALAELGDRESAPAMAQLLGHHNSEWRSQHGPLIHALGRLDAREHLPAIRAALAPAPEDTPGSSAEFFFVMEGVQVLARFNTPEAWSAIRELAAATPHRRRAVTLALGHVRSPEAQTILAENLEHPESSVRQAACASLYQALKARRPEIAQEWREDPCIRPESPEWPANMKKIRGFLD